MPETRTPAEPLGAEDTARLTEFARAFKAAARAVVLYPPAHPAIATTLGRIALVTSAPQLSGPMRITVVPEGLLLDGRAPARPDQSIGELATLLHDHLVGRLTVHPGGDVEAWRAFLLLLARPTDDVRAEGGIERVWMTMAGRHLELAEIDYAEVLRERAGSAAESWAHIIDSCLRGMALDDDEAAIYELLRIAGDPEKLSTLISALQAKGQQEGKTIGGAAAALVQMLQGIVRAVNASDPAQLDPVLRNVAEATAHLPPDVLLAVLSERAAANEEKSRAVDAVVSRMSEGTIARFVSRNVISEGTSTDRLAQAFQALVGDSADRDRLLALARDDVAASPLGSTEGFESIWRHVAEKLLASYSDEAYVSDTYGRELSEAQVRAIDVEQVGDDPPDRVARWLGSVSTVEIRSLDIRLVLDLLQIEADEERWGDLMVPVVALVEDLLLVGDVDAALSIIDVIVREAAPGGTKERRQHAMIGIDLLVSGSMLRNLATHLPALEPAAFERLKTLCLSFGRVLVRRIAELLATDEAGRARGRLTEILLGFGAVGRQTVESLKSSPNPAVRRTAIQLLREFGGLDALPELTELLDDTEPQVQRDAVRAIIGIGNERGYEVLQQALLKGTETSRHAIMQAVTGLRDERAAPLFGYIVRHLSPKGSLTEIYRRALESLGTLKDPSGIEPLREALYRGEWWRPRVTATLRATAAASLARIGTPEAVTVLERAAADGPRGVRAAVRPLLARLRTPARAARSGR